MSVHLHRFAGAHAVRCEFTPESRRKGDARAVRQQQSEHASASVREDLLDRYSARMPTVEFGIRGRLGPFFAQYAWYANMEGRMEIPLLVEGAVFAEAFRLFALGVSFDGEFVEHRRVRRELRGIDR